LWDWVGMDAANGVHHSLCVANVHDDGLADIGQVETD
jgi:hypothetical protein